MLRASYVLPIRWSPDVDTDELVSYLGWLATVVDDVVVVDGSDEAHFAELARRRPPAARHAAPDADLHFANGKVDGVITGLRMARHDRVVIADDDVRYDAASLAAVVAALDHAEAVVPQNYFAPLPWHAAWDTARTLLNRVSGGDFPGTLGVRRDCVPAAGGYDGDVLFENLELLRTVAATGGRVVRLPDCFVRRLPPTAPRFRSQRVRQAYDELARPARMALSLAIVPALAVALARRRFGGIAVAVAATVALAEAGRRRGGGAAVFPAATSWWAPVWVLERGVCSWAAVAQRVAGGCRYGDRRLVRAATPVRVLRARHRP
ncbi:MAG: glycosyltransferase family 2 protein [Actinobacteria bacterium]|nr:glycosyltransferase family 2 protein [Actinomycetota bacterium]